MELLKIAGLTYGILTAIAVLFQFALAAGLPWGFLAMGGKYPLQFPPRLRITAVVQALILAGLGLIVLSESGLLSFKITGFFSFSIWIVVGISFLSMILNLITPSKWERILWGPVGILLFASSLFVALN